MPYMTKNAIEQYRLEAKAEAFKLALSYVNGANGVSGKETLTMMARVSKQNLADHIRMHGEYCA